MSGNIELIDKTISKIESARDAPKLRSLNLR